MSDHEPMRTCYYLPGEVCPVCGCDVITNGQLVWCANVDVCGYVRTAAEHRERKERRKEEESERD